MGDGRDKRKLQRVGTLGSEEERRAKGAGGDVHFIVVVSVVPVCSNGHLTTQNLPALQSPP